MEVIIRTQDRTELMVCRNEFKIRNFKANGISNPPGSHLTHELIGLNHKGDEIVLGNFKTEKTAIKELDRIQSEIFYCIKFKNEKIPIIEINEDYEVE